MRILILLLTAFLTSSAFADFHKVMVQNLDLDYEAPYGRGTVEKVGIGLGLAPEGYNIELQRTDDSFELTSPYVDFTWRNPLKFLFETEKVVARKTSAGLGTKTQYVQSEYFMIKPKDRGEYKAFKVKGECDGKSSGRFDERFLEDCRKKLDLTIKTVEVPDDFILYKFSRHLPPLPTEGIEIPADNIVARINDGDLFLQIYIKYVFYAGLRTWGHVTYEKDYKTIAIRVDQIKFGYIPVTGLVMKLLKENIKNPDIKVDPPWIRINLSALHEVK